MGDYGEGHHCRIIIVTHKLCDRNSVAACREILTETTKMVQSMKPALESIDRIGNVPRQQVDAVQRMPAASAVNNLHSEVNTFSLIASEKNASSIIFRIVQ